MMIKHHTWEFGYVMAHDDFIGTEYISGASYRIGRYFEIYNILGVFGHSLKVKYMKMSFTFTGRKLVLMGKRKEKRKLLFYVSKLPKIYQIWLPNVALYTKKAMNYITMN